jgi:hypothetical protein
MKLTGKILKSFLYIWAAAILWIYVGSLVNFHQNKIWGKALLPQLLYAKRDKEHTIDFNKLIKTDPPKNLNPFNVDYFTGIPASPSIEYFNVSSSTDIILTAKTILVKRFISSDGLRAPPLS